MFGRVPIKYTAEPWVIFAEIPMAEFVIRGIVVQDSNQNERAIRELAVDRRLEDWVMGKCRNLIHYHGDGQQDQEMEIIRNGYDW